MRTRREQRAEKQEILDGGIVRGDGSDESGSEMAALIDEAAEGSLWYEKRGWDGESRPRKTEGYGR